MGQIPVKDELMPSMNVLKAKASIARDGRSCVWNDIQAAMLKVTMKHEDEFIDLMRDVRTIKRPRKINEAIAKGEKITSENIKQDFSAFKE